MSIYFGLNKIFLIEKISVPWKTVKGTWNSSLFKMIKSLGKKLWRIMSNFIIVKLWSCPKNGKRYWNRPMNLLLNKTLGEKKKKRIPNPFILLATLHSLTLPTCSLASISTCSFCVWSGAWSFSPTTSLSLLLLDTYHSSSERRLPHHFNKCHNDYLNSAKCFCILLQT